MKLEERDTEWLKTRSDELAPLRDEYYKISRILGKRRDLENANSKRDNLKKLTLATSFKECDYPSMGSEASNGSVILTDYEQARSLVQALNADSGYTYAYQLDWDEPGDYIVEPDYDYDHDGDVRYTATLKKNGVCGV